MTQRYRHIMMYIKNHHIAVVIDRDGTYSRRYNNVTQASVDRMLDLLPEHTLSVSYGSIWLHWHYFTTEAWLPSDDESDDPFVGYSGPSALTLEERDLKKDMDEQFGDEFMRIADEKIVARGTPKLQLDEGTPDEDTTITPKLQLDE